MFANTFQSGFISIFYSVGANPLSIWDKQVKNGHIRRVVDDEVKSLVLEISGTNVATTYITCPIKPRASLGIKLPFLVMVIKNMKKYFTFEIQILDDKDMHRRFRVSNFQSTTKVRPFCTTMPIGLSGGWNQIQFNLADFTRRAYGTVYRETMRVQIHANIRIRRIYFTDRLYADEEMPNEFKLFLPGTAKGKEAARTSKDEAEKKAVAAVATEGVSAPPPTSEAPKDEEEKVQMEEAEIPPPPTPAESAVEGEEKAVEVGEVAPAGEEVAAEAGEAVPVEEGGEAVAPTEGVEEGETPAEAAEGEGAPAEAPAAEEGEPAQAEVVEGAPAEPAEGGGEGEAAPVAESPEGESPAESPTTAAETTADESPTETDATAAETTDAPTDE